MKDVGILTFVGSERGADPVFRNDVAEIEGRLRFIYDGWQLRPVFGGEPFHPGDRAIDSASLGRLHVHHVVEAGACVILVLLAGEVDARLVAEVVRYVDARIRPRIPLFVLGLDEPAARSHASLMRVTGELRAIDRPHEAAGVPIREDDAAFYAFSDRIEALRDAVRSQKRDVGFRDDLRRHVHLSVCPGTSAPLSWRLPTLHLFASAGITSAVCDAEELSRRARSLLGAGGPPLDPRLFDSKPALEVRRPGDLAERAVAQAVRDFADEHLAASVTLGPILPAAASPERVAFLLSALEDRDGSPQPPLCTSTGDDDAAALTQFLLVRSTLRVPPGVPFLDPQQRRPAAVAATFTVAGWNGARLRLSVPDALRSSPGLRDLSASEVTAARLSFAAGGARLSVFEGSTEPGLIPDEIVLPCPVPPERLFDEWPADRMALLRGRHAAALEALAKGAGIEVRYAGRTSASGQPEKAL